MNDESSIILSTNVNWMRMKETDVLAHRSIHRVMAIFGLTISVTTKLNFFFCSRCFLVLLVCMDEKDANDVKKKRKTKKKTEIIKCEATATIKLSGN